MLRIGVFGASFNPPTLGHQDVVYQALSSFDTILLVPSLAHPFHKSLLPIAQRLAMLELLVKSWPTVVQSQVVIFNIEEKLRNEKPHDALIYTYDVLTAITAFYAQQSIAAQITFIMGPDIAALPVWQTFYRYQDLEKTWPLFVAKEQMPIRSTTVKDTLLAHWGKPSLEGALQSLVGEAIARYIMRNGLYLPGDEGEHT